MRIRTPCENAAEARAIAHELAEDYRRVRAFTRELCQPLAIEDCVIQSMADVSPTKWHLAHTTWFFETFVLSKVSKDYTPFNPEFGYLFNSYYLSVGERHCRAKRGLISRPTVAEVWEYRQFVDEQMMALLDQADALLMMECADLIRLGLNHEQQHQELILTDIKHVFSSNPLRPAYRQGARPALAECTLHMSWIRYPEGVRWIGHEGAGFAYDNESPRHRVFLDTFELASRPVTNAEYRAFMADNGYCRGELWLSDGWKTVREHGWESPLYWEKRDGDWWNMTLWGMRPVNDDEPVCHVSYYEADAFARWAGARLPREEEWETAACGAAIDGNFADQMVCHPLAAQKESGGLAQMFGDVWQWTSSAYLPYPGYRPAAGAIGEYNGKFMCNQFVLRGGSCATPLSHIRLTYRNFFPPDARWQFSGFRLARDI